MASGRRSHQVVGDQQRRADPAIEYFEQLIWIGGSELDTLHRIKRGRRAAAGAAYAQRRALSLPAIAEHGNIRFPVLVLMHVEGDLGIGQIFEGDAAVSSEISLCLRRSFSVLSLDPVMTVRRKAEFPAVQVNRGIGQRYQI